MNDKDEYIYDEHGDKIEKEEPVTNKSSGNAKEKGMEKYKSKGTVRFPFITGNLFLGLFVLSLVSLILSLLYYQKTIYIALFFTFLSATFVLFGYLIINEKEVVALQRLGVFWKILDPGIHFIIPGVDKIVYKDPKTKTLLTEKAVKLPMFEEINNDPNQTIDFQDSAEKGVDFGVYYIIEDSTKATYYAVDLEKFIKDTVESAAKAVFGNTLVDDAIENKFAVTDNILSKLNDSIIGTGNITAVKSFENAGIRIASVYFNDINLSVSTIEKRKLLFNTRQDEKIAQEQNKVETVKVQIEEQKKLQRKKTDEGIRLGLEAIAGIDKTKPEDRMTINEAAKFKIETAKYGGGVNQISEINISGDPSDPRSTIAGLAAIAGKASEEARGRSTTETVEKKGEKNEVDDKKIETVKDTEKEPKGDAEVEKKEMNK